MAASKPPRPPPSTALPARRDRQWLLPTNHKLRNLVSISIRNISLQSPSPARRRGKTIDDDAVPYALKSPAKIVAMREQKALERSSSSSDLRSVVEDKDAEAAVVESPVDSGVLLGDGSPVKSVVGRARGLQDGLETSTTKPTTRPKIRHMRRRSTLEWANATPQRRQERLEKVTEERMVDCFFSLHVEGVEEPVYVSETVAKTMNPTFRHVDFSACGPGITRLERVTVKVWIKGVKLVEWRQLMEMDLHLRSLQYLGKSLDTLTHTLPTNALILHLPDGVYIPSASLHTFPPPPTPLQPTLAARSASIRILPTSSFDALLRLAKLDDSIQDALAVRNKLAADLENLLQANKQALEDRDKVAEAEDRLKTIEYAKTTVGKQMEKARKQVEERQASLELRKKLMREDLDRRKHEQKAMRESLPDLPDLRDEREIRRKAIHAQRRRICEDLQKVYPITPIPKQSLAFTIRDLHLPNSDDLDTEPLDTVAAAFGHVSHIILSLSHYLSQPLPYPLHPRSSTSTILDPISLLKTGNASTHPDDRRTYPLYSKNAPRFRFDYAVFCLNKNIQLLLETHFNVRVLDIRHTLPNLKYLLYVATAGEGDLPARKAGGVRGLLRAGSGRPSDRAGSEEGTGSGGFGGAKKEAAPASAAANGKPKGAVESLRRNIGGKKPG